MKITKRYWAANLLALAAAFLVPSLLGSSQDPEPWEALVVGILTVVSIQVGLMLLLTSAPPSRPLTVSVASNDSHSLRDESMAQAAAGNLEAAQTLMMYALYVQSLEHEEQRLFERRQ